MNATMQPRMDWLVSRLAPWVLVTGTALALGATASTDLLGLSQLQGHVSDLESASSPSTTLPDDQRASLAEEVAWLKHASFEARAALRLLEGLREHLTLSEVTDYVADLGRILEEIPAIESVVEARQLGQGLRMARERLDQGCMTFATWILVARLVEPSQSAFHVPARFVEWTETVQEPPLMPGASDFTLRRRLAALVPEDVDHPASAG